MTGLTLFSLLVGALGIILLVALGVAAEMKSPIKENSVLVLRLNGDLPDKAQEDLLSKLTDNTKPGMADMVRAVRLATSNENIRGIYIEAGVPSSSLAQLQELRRALANFRRSGKWIVAYGDHYTQGAYYVASVANYLYINPQGVLDWHGLGSQPYFVRDLLAKVGVKMMAVKVGKYKSYTETFTEEKMSQPARMQSQRLLDGSWTEMKQAVSQSRQISVDTLQALADRMAWSDKPQQLVSKKMVDALLYEDQVKRKIKSLLSIEQDQPIAQVAPRDLQDEKMADNEVAIYYMEGEIVDGWMPMPLHSGEPIIAAKSVCKDLEDLAEDDDVKAVVLRISSPGGSAFASEQIWHQIIEMRKKKPVVVSMGSYAASGGYYIASAAQYIVAQPTTITGSIGIFGLIPDVSELLTDKLGIRFDEVKTARNATFGAVGRPMTAEQITALQHRIDLGYLTFKQRVSQGRHLSMDEVEQRAQGHVFLAQDALSLRLVDALGGLQDAVEKAAQMARLEDYSTMDYPDESDWMERLNTSLQEDVALQTDGQFRQILGPFYDTILLLRSMQSKDPIQARMPMVFTLD